MQLPQIILKEKLPLDSFQVSSVDSSLKIEPEFQQKLTQNWKEFVAEAESKGNSLWDGTYYRLENIDELNQGKKEFKFSELKYSTLRGITQEAIVNSNIFKQYPIYTCATAGLILTNDNFYVFGSRKDNTMHTQSMDFIGGGLQSDELTLNSGIDIQSNMFKELKEETNLESKNIKSIECVGLILSTKTNFIFIFNISLKLNKEELISIFKTRSDDEMKDLIFVPKEELKGYLSDKGGYRPLVPELL